MARPQRMPGRHFACPDWNVTTTSVLRTRKGIIESSPVIKAAWHLGFSGTVRAFISFRPLRADSQHFGELIVRFGRNTSPGDTL
jgi:hypothetical protein